MSLLHLPICKFPSRYNFTCIFKRFINGRVRLMHSLIAVWFLSSFSFPTVNRGKCTTPCHFPAWGNVALGA